MRKLTKNKKSWLGSNKNSWWESAAFNEATYTDYLYQIMQIAQSRFKWVNLPSTCDQRYLEWTLLNQGMATIAFPKSQPGTFYSTQVSFDGTPNIYDNPTRWKSYGNNGWQFYCTPKNGVVIYDNEQRYPTMQRLMLYARELADIKQTRKVNRAQVKTPYIITAPKERKVDAENTVKQILGGEVAVLGYDTFNDVKIDAVHTDVDFLGEQLMADLRNIWNEIYNFLGVSNVPLKSERQIEDEVLTYEKPSTLASLSALNARRDAAKKLNDRFAEYLDKPIEVVWAEDNISDNYNATHDVEDMVDLMDKLQGDTPLEPGDMRTGDVQ